MVNASNSVRLGDTLITDVKTSGTYTAGTVTYPNTHGTSGQILTTTGSGTLTWQSPVMAAGNAAAANYRIFGMTFN